MVVPYLPGIVRLIISVDVRTGDPYAQSMNLSFITPFL
jgi:hypothetical protein